MNLVYIPRGGRHTTETTWHGGIN